MRPGTEGAPGASEPANGIRTPVDLVEADFRFKAAAQEFFCPAEGLHRGLSRRAIAAQPLRQYAVETAREGARIGG